MPIVIDDMEVIAEPAAPAPGHAAGSTGDAPGGETRAVELQQALQTWAWLEAERQRRLDDR